MTERFDSEVQRLSGSFSTGTTSGASAFGAIASCTDADAVGGARAFGVRGLCKGQPQGTLQASLNAAALQFADSLRWSRKSGVRAVFLEAFGTLQGWSEEQTQAAIHAQISEMRSAVAERILRKIHSGGESMFRAISASSKRLKELALQKVATSTMESKLRLAPCL